MTIKQTLERIRATGATGSWKSATKEYRVNVPNGLEDTAAYTDSASDAVELARSMMQAEDNDDRVSNEAERIQDRVAETVDGSSWEGLFLAQMRLLDSWHRNPDLHIHTEARLALEALHQHIQLGRRLARHVDSAVEDLAEDALWGKK